MKNTVDQVRQTAGDPAGQGALRLALGLGAALFALAAAPNLIRLAAEAEATAMAFWRLLVGTLFWGAVAWRRGGRRLAALRHLPGRQWGLSILAGLLLALHYLVWAWAVERTTVGQAAFLLLVQPLMTAFAAHWLLRERIHRWTLAALALTLSGALWISRVDIAAGLHSAGNLLALAAAFFSMAYLLTGRLARRDGGLPLDIYLGLLYGAGTLVALVATLAAGHGLGGFRGDTWLALLGLGLLPTVVGHSLLNWAMRHYAALTVNMGVTLSPLLATAMAWILLGERPSGALWLGAPLLMAGSWLCAWRPPRRDS
jgi:drug/metabolite transporter (DMT)-like permease